MSKFVSVIMHTVPEKIVILLSRAEMQCLSNFADKFPHPGASIPIYGTAGTCPPNIYERGTSMVMSPQYLRSDVV